MLIDPRVREGVVVAHYGMGYNSSKWLEPVHLLQLAVMQPQVLLNGGAVSPAASSSAAAGQKHSSDRGNGTVSGHRGKQKSCSGIG